MTSTLPAPPTASAEPQEGGTWLYAGPSKVILRRPSADVICVICRGVHYFGDTVNVMGSSTIAYDRVLPNDPQKLLHTRTTAVVQIL